MKSIIKFFDTLFGTGQTPQHEVEKPAPATRDIPAPAPPGEDRSESEAALGCFDQALAIDPQDARAWFDKSIALGGLGRFEEALHCLNRALAIDPANANAWFYKASALAELERHDEAVDCYNEALLIVPLWARPWGYKGLSEDKLGHGRKAMTAYRKFLELAGPKDAGQIELVRRRLHEMESKGI
jgi:tetratricopeptide (TPR) repeat protein